MKIVFFGTPSFAVPTLRALAAADGPHSDPHSGLGPGLAPDLVVSQPSRPAGRGRKLQAPPVVDAAHELGLDVVQVKSVRDPEFMDRLRELAPDVAVVVAFGQIFRRQLLTLPRLGCVNLHASLLPKYRGAAPIQAAIAAGDRITGVTTMKMGRGLDTGPMLLRREVPIERHQTTADLAPILAEAGAELMVETLRGLARGELQEIPQDDAQAIYAPKIDKADGRVDWSLGARAIYDLWRAYQPWPGLHAELGDAAVKLRRLRPATPDDLDAAALDGDAATAEPGTFVGLGAKPGEAGDRPLLVACGGAGVGAGVGDTLLAVERLQRPGKKPVSGADLANGEHLQPGIRFT